MGYEKVFFSYSRIDGERAALRLANDLHKLHSNLQITRFNAAAGIFFNDDLETAVKEADCILFIATPQSTSKNVLSEVYFAMEENKEVVPLIFEECELPFRLRNLSYIDFIEDYNHGFAKLVKLLDVHPDSADAHKSANLQQHAVSDAIPEMADEHNHGRQLKEELLWGRALSTNSIDLYNEYLSNFPRGKFRHLALQMKSELERGTVGSTGHAIGKNADDLKQGKGSNRKVISIVALSIIGLLIAGLATYFFVNSKGSTAGFADHNGGSGDTSAISNSPVVDKTQQPSSTESGNALLPDQLSKSSAAPQTDPSTANGQGDSKFSNPSADFDALIYEKIPGSWYETIQGDDGITSLSGQTYYSNGNLEGVNTFKNPDGTVIGTLTYLGTWSAKDGYLYEEVTSSSDHSVLAVGYNQRSRITNITTDVVDYVDAQGISRRMLRLKL